MNFFFTKIVCDCRGLKDERFENVRLTVDLAILGRKNYFSGGAVPILCVYDNLQSRVRNGIFFLMLSDVW